MRLEVDKSQMLSHAIMSISDAVYLTNRNSRIIYANAAFLQLYGYCEEDVVGESAELLWADKQEFRIWSEQPVADGSHLREEFIHCRRDGKKLPVSLTRSEIHDESGRFCATVVVARDISHRHQVEAELRNAREQAEMASQARGEFLARMSHEIRTPMNGILGMAELALATELTPEQRSYIRVIKSSGDMLLEILNDILDISRLEAGKLKLENIEFDLRLTIRTAIDIFYYKARDKGLAVHLAVADDVPHIVYGDPYRLKQVICNLLSNAIKFTDEGEVWLNVDALNESHVGGEEAPGASHVRFAVVDSGIGVPVQMQRKIFDSFTQADGSISRRYGGTGLGTTIAMQLVELMGGSIGMESPQQRLHFEVGGPGSEFWFTLPFALSQLHEGPVHESDLHQLAGVELIFLDDQSEDHTQLLSLLKHWGLQLHHFYDIGQLLDYFHTSTAEQKDGVATTRIFMVSRHLHQVDLYWLVPKLKEIDPHLPVILYTSAAKEFDEKSLQSFGIDALLRKPWSESRLFNTFVDQLGLERLVDRRLWSDESDSVDRHGGCSGSKKLSGRRIEILVAEDNEVNQMVIRAMLTKMGFAFEIAADGIEALSMALQKRYDIILMDVQMPGLDGYEVTRRLRAHDGLSSQVPIVAVTADALKGVEARCLEAGMNGYIVKPYNSEEICSAIMEWCRPE